MKKSVPGTRLSAADAAFLYLERKEIPLAIASVSIFDGAIPFDEFVASIDSKLHLVPRRGTGRGVSCSERCAEKLDSNR